MRESIFLKMNQALSVVMFDDVLRKNVIVEMQRQVCRLYNRSVGLTSSLEDDVKSTAPSFIVKCKC